MNIYRQPLRTQIFLLFCASQESKFSCSFSWQIGSLTNGRDSLFPIVMTLMTWHLKFVVTLIFCGDNNSFNVEKFFQTWHLFKQCYVIMRDFISEYNFQMNTMSLLLNARARYPNSAEIDIQKCPKGFLKLRTRGNGTIIIHNFTNKTSNGKKECKGNITEIYLIAYWTNYNISYKRSIQITQTSPRLRPWPVTLTLPQGQEKLSPVLYWTLVQ